MSFVNLTGTALGRCALVPHGLAEGDSGVSYLWFDEDEHVRYAAENTTSHVCF